MYRAKMFEGEHAVTIVSETKNRQNLLYLGFWVVNQPNYISIHLTFMLGRLQPGMLQQMLVLTLLTVAT